MLCNKKCIGFLCYVFLLIISKESFSQERIGLTIGNYNGVHANFQNPSANVLSPTRWQINLIAAGSFVENNYAFLTDTKLIDVLKNSGSISTVGDVNEGATNEGDIILNYFDNNKKKYFQTDLMVTGPSAVFHVKDHSIGIFTNARTLVSGNRIPAVFGYYNYDRILENESFVADPFSVAGLTWSEIGFNYGHTILKTPYEQLDGGISVKFIQAYEAFYLENHDQLNLTKLENDELLFNGGDISFAYSGMAFNENTSRNFQKNGNGVAVDLGLTYTVRPGKKADEYQWKVGLSLLDFGKVWMKGNAEQHRINAIDLFDIAEADFQNIESLQDLTTLITDEVYNGQGTSLQDDKFSLWLPGGLSLQAEYGGLKPFYLNMMMVQRIRTAAPGVERGNLFAITPRVEIKWFAASIPLLLYNDKDFRIGTAIRLGPITIGSDNLISIVKQQREFTGSDVYVALKINPFNLGKGGKGSGSKGKSGINCYNF